MVCWLTSVSSISVLFIGQSSVRHRPGLLPLATMLSVTEGRSTTAHERWRHRNRLPASFFQHDTGQSRYNAVSFQQNTHIIHLIVRPRRDIWWHWWHQNIIYVLYLQLHALRNKSLCHDKLCYGRKLFEQKQKCRNLYDIVVVVCMICSQMATFGAASGRNFHLNI